MCFENATEIFLVHSMSHPFEEETKYTRITMIIIFIDLFAYEMII